MTLSRIFLCFCLSFTGGIFISSFFAPPLFMLGAGLILAILLISVFWQYKKLVVIGFCILFLIAGVWRHQIAELKVFNNELRKHNDSGETITLVGTIVSEPDIREKSQKLTLDNLAIVGEGDPPTIISGRVLVTTSRYPEYQYGDKLKITGKLETPQEFEDFNYKGYLAKDGIYSVIYRSKIELLERGKYTGPTRATYAKILDFKNKLRESIYQNLSPSQSSILGAMILGDKSRMSGCSEKEIKAAEERGEKCLKLKEKLNITGLRHIACVSGMHVIILTTILMYFLVQSGLLSRGKAFYFILLIVWLFIVMAGFQTSGIRAGIMGSLLLLAQKVGRLRSGGRAITFAATAMLIYNPLWLKLDVGFQLSFLAALGIIYWGPLFIEWLRKIPAKGILAMTFSAQIFTLPILIYNFGYISLVSPFTNLLVVPLISFIMISGFIFGLAGIIWQHLGWLLSLPAWLLLTYVIKIVDGFVSISWAHLTIENIPSLIRYILTLGGISDGVHWIWLFISYLILGLITWQLNEKQKLKFLQY